MGTTQLPDISGINTAVALRQLGNNMKLYMKLLDQFQKNYSETGRDIAAAIASNDMATAERSAHTVKGLAGSLGASALQETARELERLCRESADSALLSATLEAFSQTLQETIGAIRSYLENSAASTPTAPAPQADTSRLVSQLAALAFHVQENDARALMLFDELRPAITAYDKSLANALAAALEQFDFSAAADALTAARAKLR